MADNVEKKVLLTVDILNNFVDAKKNADDAKKALDDFIKSGKEDATLQNKLAAEYAKTNNQLREAKKSLESASKAEDILTASTEKANKTLGEMQRELSALRNAPLDEKKLGADGIKEVKQRMADLTSAIQDYKNEIKALDTGEVWGNAAEGIGFVASSLSAFGSTLKTLGIDAEIEWINKLQESTKELIAIVQAMGVITEYLEKKKFALLNATMANFYAEKNEALAKALNINLTKRQAAAETAMTVIKGKGSIASKAAAAAQWLWNAAIAANPLGVLLVGAIALIAGIIALTKVFDSSANAQEIATKASERYAEQQKKTDASIEEHNRQANNAIKDRELNLREEIVTMQKNGASAEAIAKAKAKAEEDERAIRYKNALANELDSREDLRNKEKELKAHEKLLSTLEEGSKKYKEQADIVDELRKSKNAIIDTLQDEINKQREIEIERQEALKKQKEIEKKRLKASQENSLKLLESQKKLSDEQAKLTQTGLSKEFAVQQQWEATEFERNQAYEQEKLSMQRKFGKITATEYRQQLNQLAAEKTTFNAQQLADSQKHLSDTLAQLKSLVAQTTDEQIKAVETKYAQAVKDLGDMTEPVQLMGESDENFQKRYKEYEEFMFNKATYELELEKQQAKDIAAIRKEAKDKQITEINEANAEQYAEDLAKYSDNEAKKTQIEIDELKRRIEAKKAAGLSTAKDEASLRSAEASQRAMQLNKDLADSTLSAKGKYDIKKAYLEQELEAVKGNSEAEAEIMAQMTENRSEYLQNLSDSISNWGGQVMDIADTVNSAIEEHENAQLEQYESDNEAKQEALEKRLDAGLISQAEYDNQTAALDAGLEQKQKELQLKQAKRQKAMAIMNATLNAAASIIASLAQSPIAIGLIPNPAGIASLALATTMGVAQVAAAIATPLPQASRGALLNGASHANGGIPIEAEGGEAIINKRSTSMFKPLLSAINEAGGGVKFAAGGIPTDMRMQYDGGYTARTIQREQNSPTKKDFDTLSNTIKQMKIYTTIDDIRKGDKQYTEIEQLKTY